MSKAGGEAAADGDKKYIVSQYFNNASNSLELIHMKIGFIRY
jgi:hypothetical protein